MQSLAPALAPTVTDKNRAIQTDVALRSYVEARKDIGDREAAHRCIRYLLCVYGVKL